VAENEPSELEKAAAQEERASLVGDFFHFLVRDMKWWLVPLLLILLGLGLLMTLSSSAVAPFIYTLF
jgi:hypothetical protein